MTRRESIQRAVVVLEGDKVISSEKTGLAPLLRASKYVLNTQDEILVLTLISVELDGSGPGPGPGPSSSRGDYHGCNNRREEDPYIRFLRQEISQKKEDFRRIFRPFYERCRSNGVKFQVKVAAGFDPKDIITVEANSAGATWVIVDSSFARHLTFRLSGTECDVSLVSDTDEDVVHDRWIAMDEPESSMSIEVTHNPTSPKMLKGSTSLKEPTICYWPSTSRESEQETFSEPLIENECLRQAEQTKSRSIPSRNCIRLEKAQELSWEEILQITKRFSTKAWNNDPEKNYSTHIGSFQNQPVLVQRLLACSRRILKAEMRAALSMHHKNIMVPTGYHRSENGTILIFPLLQGLTSLDRYIWGPERMELKFPARLKIAVSIADGIRYMHEECPQGPVLHGDLQPRKIFLGSNLQPMVKPLETESLIRISGFGKASWLSLNTGNRRCDLDSSVTLVKNDVLQFGVLLLRLFCRTSAPEDDKSLIEWARPLMLKRKFHELLEEDSNISDLHGIYRVMAAATACTRSKPISRPCMTQVICLLKGEQFCSMQTSPSDSSF